MLTKVPATINKSARLVTLRHPNAMDCEVFRKQVTRVDTPVADDYAGLPTLGGLGVISSDDEVEFEYIDIGEARVVFLGGFQAQLGNTMDNDTGLAYADAPIEALMECVADPSAPEFFVLDKNDMVTVYPVPGVAIVYEVAGVTGNVNIPPYTRKYLLQPRSDMNVGI